jgi:hypothetical protein
MKSNYLKYGIISTVLLLSGSIYLLFSERSEKSVSADFSVHHTAPLYEVLSAEPIEKTEAEKEYCRQKCTGQITRNSIVKNQSAQ